MPHGKILSTHEVNARLSPLGLRLGVVNQFAPYAADAGGQWVKSKAPQGALDLWTYSQHIAGWLLPAKWTLVQFGHATVLRPHESLLLSQLALGAPVEDLGNPAFVFENPLQRQASNATDLLVVQVVFWAFLLQWHLHLVSSQTQTGEWLSVEDGFAYFHASAQGLQDAQRAMASFETKPHVSPSWVVAMDT